VTLRKIGQEELGHILNQHSHWLESNGQEGSCADLSNVDLRDTDFKYFKYDILCGVDFRGSNLVGADLRGTDLTGTDLRGAKLDRNILSCWALKDTKWLKSDIPWFIQHSRYRLWADTIQILDE
jgi:uncharacterized protein YjbI with pentapeptide repeats